MRVHVVSDVHGQVEALARAGDGADALLCLGDLVEFLDYRDHSAGIMGSLFGPEAVGRYVELRTARRFDQARELSGRLWAGLGADRGAVVESAVRGQYAELCAAFPEPTYLTFGNVDVPHLLAEYLRPGLRLLDGEVVEIGGARVGFVGGGLRTPMRTPCERSDEEFADRVSALGSVDVLCTHIPPELPELLYDTEAGRFERGSEALLRVIQETQPAWALFGHVHQPWAEQLTIGRTRCVNVGHFRARQVPYVLDL